MIGGDAGLTPAAVITQMSPFGQLRVLAELTTPEGSKMGAKTFGKALNRLLSTHFPGYECVGWGDPAAGAKSQTDEQTWLQVMQAVTGFPWRPAPTNKLLMRLEAVREAINTVLDGEPGFLISSVCKVLRKGFNAGYRFKKKADGTFGDEPDKNEYSHVHDAMQYAALGHGLHIDVLGRRQTSEKARRQTRAIDEDHPEGAWQPGRQAYAED